MKRTLEMKLLSIALTLIMIFVSYVAMPAKALAEEAERAVLAENIEQYAAANDFSQDNMLTYSPLVGELREDRDESMKVFRRADGAQEAVIYSDPVHFLKDEAWETIDNTLELVTLEDGTQAYRNKANDFIVSFSPYFNADKLITVESKGHILSWRFTEDVFFALEELVKEETETQEIEAPEEPEQEEQPPGEPEESETIEESEEEQGGQETPSDETEEPEADETEIPSVEAELPDEDNPEEDPSEEPEEAETPDEDVETEGKIESEEPETETIEEPEAEDEPAYETLKITDAKAEVADREQKEPETDEERDMLLRFPEGLTSEIAYIDPDTGLNLHYILSGKRLSERIILESTPETAIAYTALLTTNGLKAEDRDGRIVFVDEAGEVIFEIMAPFMYDANGEECGEIEVRLFETEDGYAYTLIPDEAWIKNEARAYPIVIDPDIRPPFSGSATDTYIASSAPNADYSSQDRLKIGSNSTFHALVCFDIESLTNRLETGDVVLEATVNLSRYAQEWGGPYVKAYPITADWINSQAYTWNSFYAQTNPVNRERVIALAGAAYGSEYNHIDVTGLAKRWIAGIQPNYGILLDETETSAELIYRSANYDPQYSRHPYFSLIYVNSTGLEGRYSYYSQDAGRAGTGSVNLFSGNLTWTHTDAGIANGALPISLTHVYNTNDRTADIGYGKGWRLNYSQSLEKVSLPNRTETAIYYRLIDGDGTRHYYKEGGNGTYVNELDKNSELTFDGTTATIQDKGGNKLIFACDSDLAHGRLTMVEDANENKTIITYTDQTITDLRIASIQEYLHGLSAGQYLSLTYTSDLLSGIVSPNGLDVSFTYASDSLIGITYADNNTSAFTYANGCLTQVRNIDDYNLNYSYGDDLHRVTRVSEKADTTPGQYLDFLYEWNSTIVRDKQGRDTVYQFDNNGQAIGVRDHEGRAMYATYNKADRTVTQLSAVSKLQSTTINLLKNGHFERSENWSLGTGASYYGDYGFNGNRTMQLNAAASISQTVSVSNGKPYTLSASVCGGAGVYVEMILSNGSTVVASPASDGVAQGSGWERITLGFKADYNGTAVVRVVNGGSTTAWVDYVQLEQSEAPGRYNMLENGDWKSGTDMFYFNGDCGSAPSGRIDISNTGIDATHPAVLDDHVYKIVGSASNNYLYSCTKCIGTAGDTWTFGAWCYTEAPARTVQRVRNTAPYYKSYSNLYLSVYFLDENGEELGNVRIPIETDLSQWQYVSGSAVAPTAYRYISLRAEFTCACNNTYFDGLQLYREEFSQAYAYDSAGNLTGYTSLIGQENSFQYDGSNNVTASTDPRGNTTTYTYDTKHNVTDVETAEGVKAHYDYNARGQVYHTRLGTDALHIDSNVERGNSGALLSKTIDARGKETVYTNQAGTRLNTKITDANGSEMIFSYGSAVAMHRLASLTSSGLGVVTYGYDTYGKLETITRGSTTYSLTYDAWNRPVQTKVGSVALSTNTYDDDFRLETVTYANGLSARYEYDDLDRVQRIKQCEDATAQNPTYVLTYEMIYNGEGDLYEIRNYRTGRASFFDYDHAGRCMASKERAFTFTENNGVYTVQSYGAILSSYGYQYDECNNLTKLTCSVLGSSWSTVYTYDGDNRAATTTLASGKVITNTYDAIGRLQKRTLKQGNTTIHETTLTYVPGNATNKTTGLVSTYQNGSDNAYSYTYDDVGNITGITQGTTSIGYVYDTANRLIRENNQVTNQTIVYDYTDDLWGNIQGKKTYAYTTAENPGTPTSTVNYAYTNSAWGDQLTEYNGQTIAYDEMGNPTTYRGYTFGWRGKQLTSASNGTNSLTFAYNEDGLRQSKTCNDITTDYYYNGSVLIGMQRGQSKFLFSYDAAGNAVSVKFNGTEYYYLRNAQGDIVKLIDANGTPVVEYTYDTWGKKVTTTGTLAGTLGLFQPFRYRGYVYDWETGFYYLQSRYYDPTTGRFISADVLLSTGQGVMGHNCYAYCSDNPIIRIDISGKIDYIYKLDGTYTVEDNRNSFEKFFGIQTPDKYYIEVDGIRYLANSKETVTLYAFDNIELDFLDTKFDELISEAEEEAVTFERIMAESIGGNLDFKLQLDDSTLYYADGIVYNKNEMGNFMWSYLLKKNGYGRLISGSLAQGGSLFGKQHRFDESHDVKARKAGIAYYKKQKKAGLIK